MDEVDASASRSDGDLATLLARMRAGDEDAAARVMNTVLAELHRIAAKQMRRERREHTLQPTALINEAYVRLLYGPQVIHDRQHFLALAAQAMRRVLVDHARQKRANKRGRGWERVTLDGLPGESTRGVDVLDLDRALEKLSVLDARAARVVELRFFGGFTDQEVCAALGQSLARVRRDWVFARSWLKPARSRTRCAPLSLNSERKPAAMR